jgi:hypothetical protein
LTRIERSHVEQELDEPEQIVGDGLPSGRGNRTARGRAVSIGAR